MRVSSSQILTASFALALVGLVAIANRDLLSGRATPFYRDIGTTQLPMRALYRTLGPASVNPHVSFGQPYHGNPNFVLAYPFPRSPRFLGLHLLLHLGIGLAGAYVLCRSLVGSPEAALFGAMTFGFSGFVVSSTCFVNATTTIAWIPWLLASVLAARRETPRAPLVAALGVAVSTALLVLGGEPALGAIGLAFAVALAVTAPAAKRKASLAALAGGGVVAGLAVLPWALEVIRASAFSSRRVRGFSWNEFAAAGLHPARLLETPFPLLFGDPSRVVEGGFWGFAVTQGNPPYHASLAFGVLPLALVVVFALSARRYEGRFWLIALLTALSLSFIPWLPGARPLYEALTPLHVLRYPVKALLGFALALGVLAALAVDRLVVGEALPRFRRRSAWGLLAAAGLLAGFAVFARWLPGVVEGWLARGFGPDWKADPHRVLAPIVHQLPGQAVLAAAALVAGALLLRDGLGTTARRLVLLGAVAAELFAASRRLLPRVPVETYLEPSPLVKAARAIPGRVYERTGKDLDPIRLGILGTIPWNDVSSFARIQTRQGWSSSGVIHGLRYAYDPDPDGSYSLLNRIATDMVSSRDWEKRLKWLRAGGVGSVIAQTVPPDVVGLQPIASETGVGIPVTLFRLTSPLPGVRRASRVLPSRDVNEAIAAFERETFDPASDVVVAGRQPPGTSPEAVDATAAARVVDEKPDLLTIETSGERPAVLHVDRTFTPQARATVNGALVTVYAVDIHLIGVPVPAGSSRVVVDLAP